MIRIGVPTLLCLAACTLLPSAARAASDTFTGAADAVFSTPANWSGGSTPVSDGTHDLVFSPVALPDGSYSLNLDLPFSANSASFAGNSSRFTLFSTNGSTLILGSGGLSTPSGAGTRSVTISNLLRLESNQTWVIGENTTVRSSGLTGSGELAKGGLGTLVLSGNSDKTGGILVQSGTLALADSTGQGTGGITVQGNAILATAASTVTLANNLFLQDGSTLANQLSSTQDASLNLNGSLTLLGANTILRLGDRLLTTFNGSLEAPTASSLTVTGQGRAVFNGTVSSNLTSLSFTGGSKALFLTEGALPSNLSLLADAGSTLGVRGDGSNNNSLLATTLARITNPASYAGQLNLESSSGSTQSYSGTLNFSSFSSPGFRLGTESSATIAADAILTATPTGFHFGGGGGTLNIAAPLLGSTDLWFSSDEGNPSTLFLQGSNSFTGKVHVSNGLLFLDSTNALPAGSSIVLGNSGYASFTPNWGPGPTLAGFLGRISTGDNASTGMVGFDAATPSTGTVSSDGLVDLSVFANPVYLGSSSAHAVFLPSSIIRAPADGILRLAALRGSALEIRSDLSSANGVGSVILGHPDAALTGTPGSYTLSGNNNYTGGTTVLNGGLILASAQALGTGAITFAPGAGSTYLRTGGGLASLSLGQTLAANNTRLVIGTDPGAGSSTISLTNVVSGSALLELHGDVVLGAANTYSGGTLISNLATVLASTNNSLGTGALEMQGGTLNFGSLAPVIGGLDGNGTIALPNNAGSLTINQSGTGDFEGQLKGSTGTSNAQLVINNAPGASLALGGTLDNLYNGGTRVNGGTLEVGASNDNPLGTGNLVLNGATLRLGNANSAVRSSALSNTLVLVGSGNRITGSGLLDASGGVTIAGGNWIAPGYSEASTNGTALVRALAFKHSITFGQGGGYEVIVSNPGGSVGVDYSTVSTYENLGFSSTALSPFTFRLVSYSLDGKAGALQGLSIGTTYSLVLAVANHGITNFSASAIALDTSAFLTGEYSISDYSFSLKPFGAGQGEQLILSFTPIPEPETWALLLLGSASLALPLLRRLRRR